ncbi:Zn-dependent metalloprotease [Allocatelliglobosispora scoriae]|uniref:Zn-dependent metalloprotease n=1 Tax=Allocatelliglobosispora scoriae TaxID=643052 RepID=A0A841BJM1_9ACTN|nr:M4 family metallopeptidase [Allocatelliglobosispora scoriae]MBB5866982.1 Zn-dependent metalloprotease [Allocatelliglobosispora scoriae]
MRRTLASIGAALLVAGLLTSTTTAPAAGAPPSPVAAAAKALQQHGPAVQAATGDAFAAGRSVVDADGGGHVRFTRTHRGLAVRGGDVVVHTAPGGAFESATSGLAAPLAVPTVTPAVPAADAAATARKAFAGQITSTGTPTLLIDATTGPGRLAWETVVRGMTLDKQTPSVLHVVTDAGSGTVIEAWDEIETVLGTGNTFYAGTVPLDTTFTTSYAMIDPSHGNNRTCTMNHGTSACITFTDADNIWGNGTLADQATVGADAHFTAAVTYDYFKNVHGRAGITGSGAGIVSRVHYGSNFNNAFWDGTQITYGDGIGNAKPFTSLDVGGHEIGHGYTNALVALTYTGESGGINEASSDIWGTAVEFTAAAPGDPGDYLIGEEIDMLGTGEPVRYMFDPALDGVAHSCWSPATAGAGNHAAAGVGDHFFFDLAEGTGFTPYGYSPVCGTAAPVIGIGRAKAEKIWYRALNLYFVSNTTYAGARVGTLAATADLYGRCSAEYRTVHAAWNAVNVLADDPCAAPATGSMLWLRADAGVATSGGLVTNWLDQSGTAHHASQAVAALQPTLVAGVVNGKPVVRFGGAQSLNLTTVNPTRFTVFVVGKNSRTASTPPGAILGGIGANPNNQLRWENPTQSGVLGTGNGIPLTVTTVGSTGAFHALSVRYDGATLRVYRDGVLKSSTAVVSTGPWLLNNIGSYLATNYLLGDVAEILVYPSALTEGNRSTTNNYLRLKYALP